MRAVWTSYDYLSRLAEKDDMVVGGVLELKLYKYPETAKTQFKWCMRKVLSIEERLEVVPFPATLTTMVDNPVEVCIRMPATLYMTSDATSIKIGVWDAANNDWNTDYIGTDI